MSSIWPSLLGQRCTGQPWVPMVTSDSSDVGLGSLGLGLGVATVRTSRCPLVLIGIGYANVLGACFCDSLAVASGGTRCILRRGCIIACVRLDHLGNDRVVLLILYGCGECLDEGVGSIY